MIEFYLRNVNTRNENIVVKMWFKIKNLPAIG